MERHYRKYARRFYRFIRHPRRRNRSAVHRWLSEQIFDRRLWVPSRYPMIHGLTLGLGIAMLPFPGQMPVAAILCAWRKWNIPMSILGCWLSNPFTWVPMVALQVRLGRWLLGHEVPETPQVEDTESGMQRMLDWATDNAGAWSLGVVVSAIICALAGWVVGHLLWIFFGHYVKVHPIRKLITRRVQVKAAKEEAAKEEAGKDPVKDESENGASKRDEMERDATDENMNVAGETPKSVKPLQKQDP